MEKSGFTHFRLFKCNLISTYKPRSSYAVGCMAFSHAFVNPISLVYFFQEGKVVAQLYQDPF